MNRAKKMRQSIHNGCGVLYFTTATMVSAQQVYTPPPLPNKDIDSFSVELKSGRYVGQSPEVVAIGDGDAKLSVSFDISDRDATFNTNYSGSISFPNSNVIAVRYGNAVETFASGSRHSSNDIVLDYIPQIKSGSLLRRRYDGINFQYTLSTKDGVKYVFNADSIRSSEKALGTIVYPSGLEIYISKNSIRNNRGYQIKVASGSEGIWQPVNNAIDYCNDAVVGLCTLSHSVTGKTYNSSDQTRGTWDRNFINALGERTTVRFSAIKVWAPNGFTYLYLPSAVKLSQSANVDEIEIQYNNSSGGNPFPDQVTVSKITRGGFSSSYEYIKSVINTNGMASRGYELKVKGLVDGQQAFEANSVTPPFSSGSASRSPSTMLNYRDGNQNITVFQSDKFGRIVGARKPDGTYVSHDIDDRNNYTYTRMGGAGVPEHVTKRVFQVNCNAMDLPKCNAPSSIEDPRGGTTNYTYNDRGQLTSIELPANVNGVRGITLYTYVMRTAFIKDANGLPVPAGPPISMLDRTITCIVSVPCESSGEKTITNYEYGPSNGLNNLQLRGVVVTGRDSDGVIRSRRTCYQYDYFGRVINETKPQAGLATCA